MSIIRVCSILFFLLLAGWVSPKADAATLSNNGNGTVTDSRTGLIWQQGEPGAMTWGAALTYCEGLSLGGRNNWRLPNIKELESLTDDARFSPAIDTTYFPNAIVTSYWSSTTDAGYPIYAWSVGFYNGHVDYDDKGAVFYVRCVRGGQSGSLGSLSISGTVTNADNATPLAGANVTINGQPYQTDAVGKYSGTNLNEGSYNVTISKTGFTTISASVTIGANSAIVRDFRLTPSGGLRVVNISSKYSGFIYYLTGTNFTVKYIADVDWGGHPPGKISFITSKNVYEVPTSTTTASQDLNIGLEFQPCTTLKVVAVSADGTASPEKSADFTMMSPILGGLAFNAIDIGTGFYYKTTQGFDLKLLNEAMDAGAIPENIPLFGKKGFNLRFVPTVSTMIDSGGGVEIGLDWDNKPIVDTKIAGVDFSLVPRLTITGEYLHPGCSYKWGGSAGVAGSMEASKSWPFVFMAGPMPIPMFAKATVGLNANLSLGVENINPVKLNGNFDINPKVRGSLEAGFNSILSGGGWLSGGADYLFQYPKDPHLKDITVDLNGGLTATALLYTWENELLHWGWSMNGVANASARAMAASTATPKPITRVYMTASNPGQFRSTPVYSANTFSPADSPSYTSSVSPIATSIFPLSNSFLSSAGSNVNLLWVNDNPARTANNRTMLVHSTFNGTSWSAPKPVADDDTADFHPASLTFSDGTIVAAWEDEKAVLADTSPLDDAVAGLEISAAVYNPTTKTWGTAVRQSSNANLEYSPKFAGKSGSNVLLTWLGNEANDLYGSSAKPNKLWYSFYNGTAWSTPQVAATIPNAIKRYSVAYDGTTANVVLALHSSDDISTLNNLELYRLTYSDGVWSALTQLTTDTVIDDNPQLALDSANNFLLTWVRGNELSSVVNFDFTGRKVIRADDEYSSNLADYKQAISTDGKIAIIYAQPSGTSSSDLFGVFYDPIFTTWSKPKQLTDDPETEKHPSIAFLGAETIIATYNRQLMLNADGTLPATPANTDLYMLKHTMGVDLALDGIQFTVTPPNPAPGDIVTFTVKALNVGDKPVAGAKVAFYNGNPAAGGVKIGETTLAGTFNAGDSLDASLVWIVPATTTSLTIYAVIDPDSTLDPLSRADNTASITIVKTDLTVSTITWEKLTETQVNITAQVSNSGTLPTTPTTVTFRRNGSTGELLSTQIVPALVKGGSVEFTVSFDISTLTDPYYTFFVAVDEANSVAEYDETNNSKSVTFPGKPADLIKKLTVLHDGTGSGTITSSPTGINCGSTCSADFIWNTPVTLTAAPIAPSSFAKWTGCNNASGTTCEIIMNAGTTVTAIFTLPVTKPGDCDNSGSISIDEVQAAINMYLGLKTPALCVDTNSNGVSIDEVQKVINGYLGL